jgi:hypothetical protein
MVFGVVLALTPILFNWLDAFTSDDPNFHFEALFQRGELLLVVAATLGAALSEMAAQGTPSKYRKLWGAVAVTGALMLLASAVWFAQIQATITENGARTPRQVAVSHHHIAIGSLILFGIAVVVGAGCVLLSRSEVDA